MYETLPLCSEFGIYKIKMSILDNNNLDFIYQNYTINLQLSTIFSK